VTLTRYWRTPGYGYGGAGCVTSQGLRIRQAGVIDGEILPALATEMGEGTGMDYSRVKFFLD
jgi:hypothetical protein